MNNENTAPESSVRVVTDKVTVHEDGGISVQGPEAMARFRLIMIKSGLEMEMIGMRLTRKAPRCFKIIADEFGIKAKRSPEGKRAAYETFCAKFGFEPKARG